MHSLNQYSSPSTSSSGAESLCARTVGVNIVINIDKASADVGLSQSRSSFSGHAKAYARRGVTLLTTRQISAKAGLKLL